jgi:hypothetical protein
MSWPADPLVTISDLEIEVGGSLLLWTQSRDPQVRTQAGLAINRGHKQVLDELMEDLPDMFRDMTGGNWITITETGYSLSYLDGVLLLLDDGTGTNTAGAPQVLKDWEAATSMFWLSNQMIGKFQTIGEATVNVMADQRTFWGGKDGKGGQAAVRKTRLYKQLKLVTDPKFQPDFNRVRLQRGFHKV